MAKKDLRKIIYFILYALFFLAAALAILSKTRWSTYSTLNIISIIMLCAFTALVHQLPLSRASYIMLACLMITEKLYLNFFAAPSFFSVFFLLDLVLILWLKHAPIKDYFAKIIAVSLCTAILLSIYDAATTKLMPLYYDIGWRFSLSALQKFLLILIFSALFVGVFAAFVKFATCFFQINTSRFSLVQHKFAGLSAYVLAFFMILLLFFDSFDTMSQISPLNTRMLRILIIFAAAVYIGLLFKAASMKENMNLAQNAESELAAYSDDLEKTLENMQDIRHDLKNVFLTMGHFVDQSDDQEMKEFYAQNIVPFLQQTVIKSDLIAKLSVLSDNRLKSFFYYKMTELLEMGVHVDAAIAPSHIEGCGHIVRILGVLIDNAAEEALLCEKKHLRINIREDENGTSIIVANEVRPAVKEKGVIAGTTEKGIHRGRGLLIIKKIIENYDNLILNSYFSDTQFVQCLTVFKTKDN
ncbi:MAG: GHKL domain-containing protein [Clostridiales bacterium]|nr:GHKL domain-containing protein [Clostridiales bacterium]